MRLPIRKYGDPILRAKGKWIEQVDDEIRTLASNMLETMEAANGVGLAAQQVGHALRLTVLDVTQVEDRPSMMTLNGEPVADLADVMPLVLVNPRLRLGEEMDLGSEGCLSFPEITADIERASSVELEAETLEGEMLRVEASGLLARALQHEVDHLNGILFIDRMSSAAKVSHSAGSAAPKRNRAAVELDRLIGDRDAAKTSWSRCAEKRKAPACSADDPLVADQRLNHVGIGIARARPARAELRVSSAESRPSDRCNAHGPIGYSYCSSTSTRKPSRNMKSVRAAQVDQTSTVQTSRFSFSRD